MTLKHGLLSALVTLGLAVESVAQAPAPQAPQGVGNVMALQGGPELMDPTTLKFAFPISVRHKPGAGLDFDATLTFNADPMNPFNQSGANAGVAFSNLSNVWTLGLTSGNAQPILNANETINSCGYSGNTPRFEYTFAVPIFTDKYGIQRQFNFVFADATECGGNGPGYFFSSANGSNMGYTSDGSGITLTGNISAGLVFTVTYPDGTGQTVTFNGYHNSNPWPLVLAEDANANTITTNTAGTSVIDTLGQTVLSGLSIANGAVSSWGTLSYQSSTQVTYNFTPSYNGGALDHVTLPDQRQYSFLYDSLGRLGKVTLPAGGWITYDYGGLGTGNGSPTLTRTIYDNNGHSSIWTYTLGSNTSGQPTTTIVDPVGTGTVITYKTAQLQNGPDPYSGSQRLLEINRQTYGSFNSSSVLLSTVATLYVGAQSNANNVILPIQSASVTTSIPDMAGITAQTNTTFNPVGQVSEVDSYDFGSAGAGAGLLLTKTVSAYPQTVYGYSNTNYPYRINSTTYPGSVTVYDGLGNMLHKTIPSYGSTGLLTQVQQWVSGTNYLTTQYAYWANGLPYSVTDPNGAVTYTSYTQCVNPNNPVNGYWGGYPSGTSTAVFNAAGTQTATLTTSQTWDCAAGVPTNATDVNGHTSVAAHVDPFFRTTSSQDWLGNATTYTYSSTGSNTSETVSTFNGGASTNDTLVTYDGLGRPLLTQSRQSPTATAYDTVGTTYDNAGRLSSTSLPYSSTAGQANPSIATSTITYDPVGRPFLATDAAGGTTQYTYSANDTFITSGPAPIGENTKRRQMESNALGQLTSVCEVTSGANSGGCSQNTPATGYFTRYTYDGDLLTQVSQNIQSGGGGSETRTMSYDGLGRKLSETLPETGTSTFVYDSDALAVCSGSYPGDQIKSTDALGNVSCATYDNLHRVQSTAVVAGTYASVTPNLNYIYDAATVNGVTMQNMAGGLAEAYTCSGSCTSKITDVGFSAVPETSGGTMTGRAISRMYESTPHSNGYTVTQATAYANGSLGALSGSGSSFTMPSITYGIDSRGRAITATDGTNSLNLVTSTGYNVAGAPNSIHLGNGDSDSSGYDSFYRPNGFTFNVAGSNPFTLSGALTLNTNSSVGAMSITDGSDASKNQNCTYSADDLKRLSSANCGSVWSQTFTYDPFGNISKSANGGTTYAAGYGPNPNNQVKSGTTASYDAVGNQTANNAGSYSWNAAGQVVSTTAAAGAQATYDALGRMVETVSGSTTNQFIYSPLGKQYAILQNGTLLRGIVPLPGGDTAVYNSTGLNYIRRTDMLGNSRLATTWANTVYSKDAYAPYGEPYDETATTDRSFTGQGADLAQNVGLYDFQFRKLDTTAGRWLSPDPSGWNAVDITNPQSLNRYSYVNNTPLDAIDPLGLYLFTLNYFACTTTYYYHFGNLQSTDRFCLPMSFSFEVADPSPNFGGGGGVGSFSMVGTPEPTSTTVKHDPNDACSVPLAPVGVSVKTNIKMANIFHVFSVVNLPVFYQLVRNKGPMDYKQGTRSLSDTGQLGPSPYAEFGNFNYGAVGAAFGIPQNALLRGAGYAQGQAGTSTPEWGNWKGGAPYGDDPNDQAQIIAGYNYYKAGCYKKK